MRENRFAALAMIDGAAGEIAANRNAQDSRTLEDTVRAPAHDAQLVADLHHRGPDVVEELNFRDGLKSARGHADCPADDACFRERRVEDAIVSVLALQAGGGLEDAALPFHLFEGLFAAGVGDVFAENGYAVVASHLVGERGGDHFDHGFRSTVKLRLRFKGSGRGIDIGRINIYSNRIDRWLFGSQSFVCRVADFLVDLRFERFDLFLVEDAFADEQEREL